MTRRRSAVDPIAVRTLSLYTVAQLGVRRRQIEEETGSVLRAAYAAGGVTWTQLGAALGVSGSIAWHLAHPRPEDGQEAATST